MIWLTLDDRDFSHSLLDEVSTEELWEHWVKFLDIGVKESGSPAEEETAQYIKRTLEDYGIPTEILRYRCYITIPREAKLKVFSPLNKDIQCLTFRSVASTPTEGIEGELVSVERDLIDETDYDGKIVLIDLASGSRRRVGRMESRLLTMQNRGALGAVIISRDSFKPTVIHQYSDFSVSGNPTSDNYHLVQKLRTVMVSNADGDYLKGLCQRGPVHVHMKVLVNTSVKTLPLPVATIKGVVEPEKFLLIGGHMDTPPFSPGVTDNASGNVAMMELARVLHNNRESLRRGVRIAWWTGHETGRYGGSTWYNDAFWHDLRYNCIAYLNIDSPGAKEATQWPTVAGGSPELRRLIAETVNTITGQKVEINLRGWQGRGGDRSFWGTGLPCYGIGSRLPEEKRDPFVAASGGGWWWHTPYATLEKGDKNILTMNVKAHIYSIIRLLNCPILPMDFINMADILISTLEELQAKGEKSRPYFDLEQVLDRAKEFKIQVENLEALVNDVISKYEAAKDKDKFKPIFAEINRCMMGVSRYINLISCTTVGKTEQIPRGMVESLLLPGLHPIITLSEMPLPYAEEFEFLRTKLIRERNKVVDGFVLAINEINEIVEKIK